MKMRLVADLDEYISGMRKAWRQIDKPQRRARRRELAWQTLGIVLAIGVVGVIAYGAIMMVASAAW